MKLLLLFACSVLLGCGVIFGLVYHTVPHLVSPDLLPRAQARERHPAPVADTIFDAGRAVRTGVAQLPADLVADAR